MIPEKTQKNMCENNLLWPWNLIRSKPEYQERHMSMNRSPSISLKTPFNVHNMYRMPNVTAAGVQNWICFVHTTMQSYARAGLPVQAHPYNIRICLGNFHHSLFFWRNLDEAWCILYEKKFSWKVRKEKEAAVDSKILLEQTFWATRRHHSKRITIY